MCAETEQAVGPRRFQAKEPAALKALLPYYAGQVKCTYIDPPYNTGEENWMRTGVPEKVVLQLWVHAGGRCEYSGCNESLWRDELTMAQMNRAYVAHIISDSPGGPRGQPVLSEKLSKDIGNLMLLCDAHHRLIDKEDVAGHPVALLTEMKQKHERRIEFLTSLGEDKKSLVVMYGANIGDHHAPLRFERAVEAMLPTRYPAESRAIELGLKNSSYTDAQEDYWRMEVSHLRHLFAQRVGARLANGDAPHLSVLAIAPQPLLMELGRLLSDIPAAEVFQLHREPQTWKWQGHPQEFSYVVRAPSTRHKCVAVNLSLSATISESRITSVLGTEASIWTLTIREPNNDFLKSRKQLGMFRECWRKLLNRIRAEHGEDACIHLFPAVPVAIAVEIGRMWMPKADLPMRVYDQNRKRNGFAYALDIKQE